MDPDRIHPLRHIDCAHGTLGWREAGSGPAMVLLHGIGSGSLSWAAQLAAFAGSHRVVAWDAPGYGESAALPQAKPLAVDYAQALSDFLSRLHIDELVLVGHSLGALVAAAWAARPSARLQALVLASPARGYGAADAAVREAKWRERVEAIERLGPQGLADERAARLCAPGAPDAAIASVRWNMARVTRQGYSQAAHMLAFDDLLTHLRQVRVRAAVLCGELDRVTEPGACAAVAAEVGATFTQLPCVAHACYTEDPDSFNAALGAAIEISLETRHV
jgi:pimeloyl-ACP methyl ester carboxylesterase